MDKRDFGGRLRTARRARGVSQEKLGALLGLSHAAVSKWEANESRPSFENLQALQQHLGISLDELMAGPGNVVREQASLYQMQPQRGGSGLSADEVQLLERFRASSEEKRRALLVLMK